MGRPVPLSKPSLTLIAFIALVGFLATFKPAVAAPFKPGDIIVADFAEIGPPAGRIIKVNPRTGEQTLISSAGELADPFGIAMAPNGKLFVADVNAISNSGDIIRVSAKTGRQKIIATSECGKHPFGIAVGASGDLFVTNVNFFTCGIGASSIDRVEPDGTQTPVSSGGLLIDPVAIAIEAHGKLLVADTYGVGAGGQPGKIIRIDPKTGAQTVVSSGGLLVDPFGIAIDAHGDLLVADRNAFGGSGGIIKVDPKTGAQEVLSSGNFFSDPAGLVIVPRRHLHWENSHWGSSMNETTEEMNDENWHSRYR